jgi:hypothetical protein
MRDANVWGGKQKKETLAKERALLKTALAAEQLRCWRAQKKLCEVGGHFALRAQRRRQQRHAAAASRGNAAPPAEAE